MSVLDLPWYVVGFGVMVSLFAFSTLAGFGFCLGAHIARGLWKGY